MVPTLCLPQHPSSAMLDTTYRDHNQVFVWQMDLQDIGICQLHSACQVIKWTYFKKLYTILGLYEMPLEYIFGDLLKSAWFMLYPHYLAFGYWVLKSEHGILWLHTYYIWYSY